jgi:hypothetical protein
LSLRLDQRIPEEARIDELEKRLAREIPGRFDREPTTEAIVQTATIAGVRPELDQVGPGELTQQIALDDHAPGNERMRE